MNNKEAIKNFSTIQHLMWQNYHHIEDNLNSPEQISRMRKAQHEIWHVKDELGKLIPPPAPPPPPGGYPDPIPVLHAHALNSWQGFYTNAWHEGKQQYWENETRKLVHEYKLHGIALHDGFLWLSSGDAEHQVFNHKTPWVWDGGKFLLDKWNPRFWELAESWLRIHKEVELDYCWHLWMWYKYNLLPFKNNDKGIVVNNLLDPRIWKYQEAMMRKVMDTYRQVYGNQYKPYVKIGNEFDHSGGGQRYHDIMYFFEKCWNVLKDYTIPEHCIIDMHKSEGTIGELRDPFICPKQGQCDKKIDMKVTDIYRSEVTNEIIRVRIYDKEKVVRYSLRVAAYPWIKDLEVGDIVNLGRHGHKIFGRKFKQEIHGFSVKEDFLRKVLFKGKLWSIINIYLGSKPTQIKRFTGDCGSWPLKLGKGATWYPKDSGLPTHHRNWADAEQSYEMAKYVFGRTRSRIIIGWYPVECIKVNIENGVERHTIDHRVEIIDWSIPKAMQKEYWKVMG